MSPTEAFAEIGFIFASVTKQPNRETPMTDEEWSSFVDQVMLLAERNRTNERRTTTVC